MDILIVVDMQNDFITGSLGSESAKGIVGAVADRVKRACDNGEKVFFTMDTHDSAYMSTQEGRNLPVIHCVPGTSGYDIAPEIARVRRDYTEIVKRDSFGSTDLMKSIGEICDANGFKGGKGLNIEICGLCAEICVSVCALMVKATFPEAIVTLDSALTAGLSKKGLDGALEVMRSCQIRVK